jgi:hypothetical protein
MADYNGWSNRETWNANLWLTNDYGHYRNINSIAADVKEPDRLGSWIRSYCVSQWPSGRTPDRCDLERVDWQEIAASWLSE